MTGNVEDLAKVRADKMISINEEEGAVAVAEWITSVETCLMEALSD